jgi:hypothetical protein
MLFHKHQNRSKLQAISTEWGIQLDIPLAALSYMHMHLHAEGGWVGGQPAHANGVPFGGRGERGPPQYKEACFVECKDPYYCLETLNSLADVATCK